MTPEEILEAFEKNHGVCIAPDEETLALIRYTYHIAYNDGANKISTLNDLRGAKQPI